MQVFFHADDYRLYLRLMSRELERNGVDCWGYCLMPNHVHLLLRPEEESSLARSVGEAHRRFALEINRRHGWKGHLWQSRFGSCVTARRHLLRAARYVELNPVRAGIVGDPAEWPWSSARAHLSGQDDGLVRVAPLLDEVGDWADFLGRPLTRKQEERIELHLRTGRPLVGRDLLPEIRRLAREASAEGALKAIA